MRCLSLMIFALFSSISAQALTITPYAPYEFDSDSGTPRLFIATDTAGLTGWIDTAAGFKQYSVTNSASSTGASVGDSNILFYVSGIPTDKEFFHVLATGSGGNIVAPILNGSSGSTDGSIYSGTPGANGYRYSIQTNGLSEFYFYINLKSICDSGGAGLEGCSGASVVTTAAGGDWGFQLKGVATDSEFTTSAPTDLSGAFSFNVYPQTVQGTTTCVGASPYFYPADGGILVDPARFTFASNSTGSSTVKDSLVVLADRTGLTFAAGTWDDNDIVARGEPTGEQTYGGFTNYTPSNAATYFGGYVYRDSAGVITSNACMTDTMVAGEIASFLKESNCFIATASFRDENAPAVELLRSFRDQFLKKTKIGRSFVSFYYSDGPLAAQWLNEHPQYRFFTLAALIPVQIFAWLVLHPISLLIPLFSLILVFGIRRYSMALGTGICLFLIFTTSAHSADATQQTQKSATPYIDSLLSGLEEDLGPAEVRTNENPDPYIQSLKKRIKKKPDTGTSYSEELRKDLDESSDPTGYSEKIKKEIGPGEAKSAIADFHSGKKLEEKRRDMIVRGSFGFRMMTSANRSYSAGSAQEATYENAYGNKFAPDLLISYEKRPFRGWLARRLGIQGAFGFSWVQADAQFKYDLSGFGFDGSSRTKIKFLTFPFLIGLTYKMNFFDFIYPYVGGGPGAFLFYESRSDGAGNSRGYSFGNWFVAGANFGLDWLSKSSSWDRYQSSGIKHTYLSVEYSRQSTFSGGLIDMTVDGIAVGLNFEI